MKQGKVEKVKKVNSNDSSYYKLKIDGETYSLWNHLPETVGKGSKVKFTYQTREKDGKERMGTEFDILTISETSVAVNNTDEANCVIMSNCQTPSLFFPCFSEVLNFLDLLD